MKQKEVPEMDDVEEIISKISEDSPYKRRPTQKRTWMTVPEMGKLLGLKKTDRYWLVHKNVFESKEIAGKIRINIASFEKWYANQIKYHKVTGEKPGKELKSAFRSNDNSIFFELFRIKKGVRKRTDFTFQPTKVVIVLIFVEGACRIYQNPARH